MSFNPFGSVRDLTARVEQTRENAGRLAEAYGFFRTTGWGEMAFQDMVAFNLWFIEPPSISYGVELDSGQVLRDSRFPRSWGGVYQWKQDAKGLYVGAYCYAVIDTNSAWATGADPGYSLTHHFTFTGIALKTLPSEFGLSVLSSPAGGSGGVTSASGGPTLG